MSFQNGETEARWMCSRELGIEKHGLSRMKLTGKKVSHLIEDTGNKLTSVWQSAQRSHASSSGAGVGGLPGLVQHQLGLEWQVYEVFFKLLLLIRSWWLPALRLGQRNVDGCAEEGSKWRGICPGPLVLVPSRLPV